MTQNILIEFSSDASGIQTGVDQLQQLGKVDKDLASQFDKTNASIKGQQDALAGTSSAVKTFTDNLGNVAKASAGAFGTKVIENFTKQGVDGAKSIAKMIDSIEASMKKVQQAASNTLNTELAEQYAKSLSDSTAQLNELYAALDEIQSQGDIFDEFGKGQEEVSGKTQTFKARLRELKSEMQQLDAAGQSDTQQFKNMSVEAAKLDQQIQITNEQIQILASKTFKSDAAIAGIRGITSAFGLGQAATALFGDQNEDLQKTLVRLNAVMQISQSIEQLDTLIKGENAAKEAIKIGLQKIAILNTQLDTAATSENIIVKNLATAAQWLLNAAMAANPGTILLAVIGAIAGALLIFSSNSETAAEKQQKINDEWEAGTKYLKAYEDQLNKPNETKIKQLKDELALLESSNASSDILLAKKKEIAFEEEYLANKRSAFSSTEIKEIDDRTQKIKELSDKVLQLTKKKDTDTNIFDRVFGGAESKKDIEDKLKAAELQLKQLQSIQDDAQKRSDDAREKGVEYQKIKNEESIKLTDERYKNEIGYAQAATNAAISGTRQRLNAELELNEKLKNQKLDTTLNPNLQQGERLAIIAESAAKEREIKNNLRKLDLEDEKSNIQAKIDAVDKGSVEELALKKKLVAEQLAIDLNTLGIDDAKKAELRAKELADQKELNKQIETEKLNNLDYLNNAALSKVEQGSKQEYNLKLNAANIQYQKELIAVGDNANKKLEIEAAYQKKVSDMSKEFEYKTIKDALDIRISTINNQIAPLEIQADAATNTQLLRLKKGLIDAQAQMDIENIKKQRDAGVISAELMASQIQGVYDTANVKKIAADRATINAILNNNKALDESEINLEIEKQTEILNSVKSTAVQKIAAQKAIFQEQKKLIADEMTLTEEQYKNGTLSEQQYQVKINEIQTKYRKLDFEETQKLEQKKQELRKQLAQAAINLGQQVSDAIFEVDAANRQKATDDAITKLEDQKTKELSAKNLTDQQKADIEAKYAAKEKKLKQDQAKRDRDAQVQQAIVNGALAITNILATMPKFDFGVASAIAIAAAIATTAVQVAKIKSTPLPGLYRGTESATEGVYRLGELGRELMYSNDTGYQLFGQRGEEVGFVPQGARVFNAKETSDLFAAGFPSMKMPAFELPTMSPLPNWAEAQLSGMNQTKQPQIDYDRIGQEFAKHVGKISDLPGVDLRIDENGIVVIAKKGHDRIQINNKRYSTK